MKSWTRRLKTLVLASSVTVFGLGGCSSAQEFRTAAADSLYTGMQSIAAGLVDGLYAVFQPDPGAK
ncbi:MAG TPA: hypothetical protein P5572_01275 [Phycisphaerae bacterium]|nr:hypothetical protein [Phycisphaerales bacterium]HRX83629.1 hypothetical protein [Phycisphaerae bacterium]